jgi:hypothetical protein
MASNRGRCVQTAKARRGRRRNPAAAGCRKARAIGEPTLAPGQADVKESSGTARSTSLVASLTESRTTLGGRRALVKHLIVTIWHNDLLDLRTQVSVPSFSTSCRSPGSFFDNRWTRREEPALSRLACLFHSGPPAPSPSCPRPRRAVLGRNRRATTLNRRPPAWSGPVPRRNRPIPPPPRRLPERNRRVAASNQRVAARNQPVAPPTERVRSRDDSGARPTGSLETSTRSFPRSPSSLERHTRSFRSPTRSLERRPGSFPGPTGSLEPFPKSLPAKVRTRPHPAYARMHSDVSRG